MSIDAHQSPGPGCARTAAHHRTQRKKKLLLIMLSDPPWLPRGARSAPCGMCSGAVVSERRIVPNHSTERLLCVPIATAALCCAGLQALRRRRGRLHPARSGTHSTRGAADNGEHSHFRAQPALQNTCSAAPGSLTLVAHCSPLPLTVRTVDEQQKTTLRSLHPPLRPFIRVR